MDIIIKRDASISADGWKCRTLNILWLCYQRRKQTFFHLWLEGSGTEDLSSIGTKSSYIAYTRMGQQATTLIEPSRGEATTVPVLV